MAVLSIPVPHSLILCIDDSEVGLRVRKLLLASVGYEVLTATTAEDGFKLFKKNPVVLVIADHFLSAESGTEITREMKRLKPEVRILILSAAMAEPPGLEFADGFLSKGESPDVLLGAISSLLAEA
ncbi:MAG: response regulator [Candidatus Korobacteraceae bacterium]